MNLKQLADDLMDLLADENIEVSLINERLYLPTAVYDPSVEEINLYGNCPSLARAGILYLLCHEYAHHIHKLQYGEPGDDYSESFQKVEEEVKHIIWKLYLAEEGE